MSLRTDQLLRGMVVENLAQRGSDFKEEVENIRTVEAYLNGNKEKLASLRESRRHIDKLNEKYKNGPTAQDIKQWLQENINHEGSKGIGVSTESTQLKDIGISRDESSKAHYQGVYGKATKTRNDFKASSSDSEDDQEWSQKKTADQLNMAEGKVFIVFQEQCLYA